MKRRTLSERFPKACDRLEELLKLRSEVQLTEETLKMADKRRMNGDEALQCRQKLTQAQEKLKAACVQADGLLACIENPCDRVTLKLRYVHGFQPTVVSRGMNVSPAGYYKRLERGLMCIEKRISEEKSR